MQCDKCGYNNEEGAQRCERCGNVLVVTVLNDEMLGPYVLRGELGRGAMARVWRAWDPKLKREIAIKEPLFDTRLPQDVLDEMGRRFVAEGIAAARLNHPNIVTIYSADVYDNRPAIAMELVEGATLTDLLKKGLLAPSAALDVLNQLLDAASYAHSMGVIHRDIKPDNVFVGRDGRVRLADFGIAHIEDSGATKATVAGTVLGTPGYMSPEQIKGEAVDARSDLFSIGVVAYEMLTGRNPFGAGDGADVTTLIYRVVNEPVAELPAIATQGLPQSVEPAIMAALEKDPALRPQSAEEFKTMLQGITTMPLPVYSGERLSAAVAVRDGGNAPKWLPYVLVGAVGVLALFLVLGNALSSSSGGAGASIATKAPTVTPVVEQSEDEVAEDEVATVSSSAGKQADTGKGASTNDARKADTGKGASTSDVSDEPREIEDDSASKKVVYEIADDAASSNEHEVDTTSNAPDTFPRKWTGTYVGRSTHTTSGTIDRYVDMEFSDVYSDGRIKGVCYVGKGQDGYAYSTYNIEGAVDWNTGAVQIEGTSWVDKGTMESWGGFRGTVDMDDWTIDGEWYDPTGVASGTSPWSMGAGTRRVASQQVSLSNEISASSSSADSDQWSSTSLIPLNWSGSYTGRSDFTDSGTVERKMDLELEPVSNGGVIEGICYIGRGQEGYAHCSYRISGTCTSTTISFEGTSWVDSGNMESWGGFRGTLNMDDWTIDGEWYDPTGVASGTSPWHMNAVQ